MSNRRNRSLFVAAWMVSVVGALAPTRASADFFSAPTDAPGGGRRICAAKGLLCLSAPTIDSPPGGGVSVHGAPTLTMNPQGDPTIAVQLGEAEVTITPTGMRFLGAAGFDGFGPLAGWQFGGPRGDLAVGLGSSPAFDGYERNGTREAPAGFPVGDTRIRKEDGWIYLYLSYGAEFSVVAPGGNHPDEPGADRGQHAARGHRPVGAAELRLLHRRRVHRAAHLRRRR